MQRLPFQSLLRIIVSPVRRFGLAGLLTIAFQGYGSDLSGVNVGPPDDWVQPQFFNRQSRGSPSDSSADDRLLLIEHQVNALENEEFFHSDRKVLSIDGVQRDSTLKIDFDPDYESLTWHWARIWREGRHLERLDTNSIQVVRRETDLDEATLNGEKSAILVLDDVRVGDIIDYAYSLKGENPISDGHFSMVVPVQVEEPADRLLTRVLWPRGRGLYALGHGCSVQPATVTSDDSIEFTWDFKDVPAVAMEDSLPLWFDPDQWVQLSDFRTWADVNQWALKLFQTSSPLSDDLSEKINEWKRLPDRQRQILAVLRFVQDEVRYFGIEIGASSEKPADPSTVFSRRFGDCKDKSLLLVTILRALGFQAFPVLVNSTSGPSIQKWQPGAGAFDHCIAAVQCYGQTWWLDPAMTWQRGLLAAHYLPNYGWGLVIAPGTTRLTAIPQTTGLPQTTTTEYFNVGLLTDPATLKVVTVAEGRDADILRATFATMKQAEIENNYTHFYADVYPNIKMSAPIDFVDDKEQDTFQTTESYSIDKVWTQPQAGIRKYECQFYPSAIAGLLKKPVNTDRALPLGIRFPGHQILRTEVTLPGPWPQGTDEKSVTDSAITFRKLYSSSGNKIVMEYEYQAMADSITPGEVSDHLQRIDQCTKLLGDTIEWKALH